MNTLHSQQHRLLIKFLIEARKKSGKSQTEVGISFGRNQKIVSLIETGQRRLDVIEFHAYIKALGYDPKELFSNLSDLLSQEAIDKGLSNSGGQ